MAAGNAVLDYLESHKLFDASFPQEKNLRDALLCFNRTRTSAMFAAWAFSSARIRQRQSTRAAFPQSITSRKNSHLCLEENVAYVSDARLPSIASAAITSFSARLHDSSAESGADRSRAPVRFGKSVSTLIRCLDALFRSLSARRFLWRNKIAMPLRSR